ncbi:crotonobetainyl-CoA:carnitine CoA-transferase CaiB-like acyl-CoA transferase [Paraburkholderia sp. BL6669N2]|uniref:CaiB/BaiF CoA transferase family protein n=1 Tax=Paraburkholderia sp. BL6669N2 TaxID=1938807 RepID=UPI000E28970F|nr:CoA transferase [Paraburkholderia sp. BL6669N2]REG50986.1 crotonobetainyl-CoA:carnitine CoA-transferase CaiB-like acyl-CoA transferase [Paraburkholderia sp. BL6669N2]
MNTCSFGALRGLVVLDLTQMLSGPYCTQLLADHGGEVIKIEPPHGDATRGFGPFKPDDNLRAYGGYFQSVNRNKQSVVLNLKCTEDTDRLRAMVVKADVLVENFRSGVMERLGLDYESLSAINPKLVYASIRGFGDGRHGVSPYQEWPAYDVIAQAMSGLMGITGKPDQPVKIGPGIGDIVPGMMAAFGIVSAVLHARQSGTGQYVDVSMTDTLLSLCERIVYQHSYQDAIPGPEGQHHPVFSPFGLFRALDGFVALACPSDAFWRSFCEAVGEPAWSDDARFRSANQRSAHRHDVNSLVESVTARHTKQELARLLGGRIPFGPVMNAQEIFADPHFRARDMLCEVEQPGSTSCVTIAGVPMKLSATPGGIFNRAPLLGEHTQAVFERFGLAPVSLTSETHL